MTARIGALTIVAALLGCASQPAPQNSYVNGVAAYKAKDFAAARVYWLKATEEGFESARNNLGYLLYYGLGGEADPSRAVVLWREAAIRGHSEAQWHLGVAYEDGEAFPQNYIESYAWYRCAIESTEAAPDDVRDLEAQIARDARESLTALRAKLAPDQFGPAEALAKRYIEAYAKRSSGT